MIRGAAPAETNRALVGAVHPGEAVHERGFPGAVLTENGVHRSGANREVRPGIGDHTGKPLPDAVKFDGGNGHPSAEPMTPSTK